MSFENTVRNRLSTGFSEKYIISLYLEILVLNTVIGGHDMEKSVALPICNENGYFEIRLESIGGLGANLGGKLMGELGANYLGLNSVSFSSYGSEKKGIACEGIYTVERPIP